MERALVLVFLWSGATMARAQLLDSLSYFGSLPARLVVKLDNRGSFISNRNVSFWGGKVGLEHGRRFQYGVGYSFLHSDVERELEVEGAGRVQARLSFGYVTPYVDYAFFQRGPWEVRIPVQFGIGGGSLVYRDLEGRKQRIARSGVFLYEPGMTVQYRFLRYLGVGAGWGLRLVLTRSEVGERLTAPVYIIGLKVFFSDLYRDLKE